MRARAGSTRASRARGLGWPGTAWAGLRRLGLACDGLAWAGLGRSKQGSLGWPATAGLGWPATQQAGIRGPRRRRRRSGDTHGPPPRHWWSARAASRDCMSRALAFYFGLVHHFFRCRAGTRTDPVRISVHSSQRLSCSASVVLSAMAPLSCSPSKPSAHCSFARKCIRDKATLAGMSAYF